ncbi:helix-turn-helix domain-containing protein [Kineosporia sp. A_224]|uniref:helix-turn-helix domain-containing protein n=1 Tax=Kineosporia sp. A_224 TaxID=1962180 RepID=UPI000B4B5B8D|nr:helix-turn-helix domain-containing protein [Kineosporia sp. A_224]
MSKNQLSQEELLALPVTVDIVTAGRAFGISRDTSYELLRRGEFPCRTLKVGRLRRVPRAEILRALGVEESAITQASA